MVWRFGPFSITRHNVSENNFGFGRGMTDHILCLIRGRYTKLVTWAQRNNLVFLTICLEDCDKESTEIKVETDSLHFKGTGGPDKKPHEVYMKFFKELDPEVSRHILWVLDRIIFLDTFTSPHKFLICG